MENGDGKFWLVSKGVGVKVFPRVASTTLRETYGYHDNKPEFNQCKNKIVIVRHPWDRLMSVFAGMIRASESGLKAYGYPLSTMTLDGLFEWMLKIDDANRDWHIRSMNGQLQGYRPEEGEVWLLEDFMEAPPFGLQVPDKHHHKTPDAQKKKWENPPHRAEYKKMWEEAYSADFELYEMALRRKHSP